jgi:putative transposase
MIGTLATGSVQDGCTILGVSRSGYYAWKNRKPGPRVEEDARLLEDIRRVHKESRQTYGVPRMTPAMQALGYPCGRKRVARLMKQGRLQGIQKKGFRPRTTDSDHSMPVSPNLLREMPPVTGKDQAWVSDITYIRTHEGWVYLSAVMDLWSRKIVGWHADSNLRSNLATTALHRAIDARMPGRGLLHHSDQGKQYASESYRSILDWTGTRQSMSRAGNCYDNAAAESLWSTIKTELVHRCTFRSRDEARLALFGYIQYYNNRRLHSSLGYRSPAQFEKAAHRPESTYPFVSTTMG